MKNIYNNLISQIDQDLPSEDAIEWIAQLGVPSWDNWYMSKVFLSGMRSPDQQTKMGAILVDWNTKREMGTGYNGHPPEQNNLPTLRAGSAKKTFKGSDGKVYKLGQSVPKDVYPLTYVTPKDNASKPFPFSDNLNEYVQQLPDKYSCMCHSEINALSSSKGTSDNAVLYIPTPSCDNCASIILSHPYIKIKRVVYYEDRNYNDILFQNNPNVKLEKYDENTHGDPIETLLKTITYIYLRKRDSKDLSKNSIKNYCK